MPSFTSISGPSLDHVYIVADQTGLAAPPGLLVGGQRGELLPQAEPDLAELDPTIRSHLGGAEGLVVGSGFIAAPSALSDQALWLQWWSGEASTEPSRLVVDLDPSSDRFCDYTDLPWFSVPRDSGRRHITGPYVDFLCSDEYALTFTLPVTHDARFVGVVGSDVYIRLFEPVMLPRLRALGGPAALVNAQGRIAVTTSIRQPVGSLVRHPDVASMWASGRSTVTDDGVTFSPAATSLWRCSTATGSRAEHGGVSAEARHHLVGQQP